MRRSLALLLAALPLTALHAPAADAYWTAGCRFDGTISFSPPLQTLPKSGTWVMDGTMSCQGAAWGTGGVIPGIDSWHAVVTGTYTGNCTQATLSDGYSLAVIGAGTTYTGYISVPWYGVTTGALTPVVGLCPTQPLSVARLTTVAAATSYLP